MPFISEILRHKSLSIVGLEKNTGKTVCLNSEKHYLIRQAVSRLVAVDDQRTSLGPLVTAEVLIQGKVLLSGAATTAVLKRQIQNLDSMGVDISIVDGALSRLSLASPTVTDCMILATGAAVSANVKQLIAKTRHLYQLICLDEVDETLRNRLNNIESGIWAIDSEGEIHDLEIASVFLIDRSEKDILRFGHTLFAAGAISDRLLKILSAKGKDITLIARDFTKIFVTPEVYVDYTRRGNRLMVLQRSKLIAITLNPTSPQGFLLDSKSTCDALSDALQTPVYDVKKIEQ